MTASSEGKGCIPSPLLFELFTPRVINLPDMQRNADGRTGLDRDYKKMTGSRFTLK